MKQPKLRAVNFELVAEKIDGKMSEPYPHLGRDDEFHSEIEHAKIALAWRKKLKCD